MIGYLAEGGKFTDRVVYYKFVELTSKINLREKEENNRKNHGFVIYV